MRMEWKRVYSLLTQTQMVTPLVHGQAVQGATAHLPATHGAALLEPASSQPSDLNTLCEVITEFSVSFKNVLLDKLW